MGRSRYKFKLGYQAVGTTTTSIGRNWVHDRPLFSQVTVGAGPVNVTFKNGKPKYLFKNNIGNIVTHGLGFLNYGIAKAGFGPEVELNFYPENLAFEFNGGLAGKIYDNRGWTGAYVIAGTEQTKSYTENLYQHEASHIWQSRFFNESFLPSWLIMGTHSKLHGFHFLDAYSKTGTLNFWELQANGL